MIQQRKEPTYRRDQLAEALRTRIGGGEFAVGAEVPSGRELAIEYGCAPMTAHAALHILAEEGVITIRPGRGSTVAQVDRSIGGPADRARRSARDGSLFRPGETQTILCAALAESPEPEAVAAFGLDEGAALGMREYTVTDQAGTVVTYAVSYVHPDMWELVAEVREAAPIRDGIIGALGRVLGRRAAPNPPTKYKAGAASAPEARMLGVVEGSPVLVEVTECQQADGAVLEWNRSVHPLDYWVGGA